MAEKMKDKKVIERNTYGVDEKLEKEFDFSHLKRSLKYVKKYIFKMVLALVLAGVSTVFVLTGPQVIRIAIDECMSKDGKYYGDVTMLVLLGAAYLGCMVVSSILTAISALNGGSLKRS